MRFFKTHKNLLTFATICAAIILMITDGALEQKNNTPLQFVILIVAVVFIVYLQIYLPENYKDEIAEITPGHYTKDKDFSSFSNLSNCQLFPHNKKAFMPRSYGKKDIIAIEAELIINKTNNMAKTPQKGPAKKPGKTAATLSPVDNIEKTGNISKPPVVDQTIKPEKEADLSTNTIDATSDVLIDPSKTPDYVAIEKEKTAAEIEEDKKNAQLGCVKSFSLNGIPPKYRSMYQDVCAMALHNNAEPKPLAVLESTLRKFGHPYLVEYSGTYMAAFKLSFLRIPVQGFFAITG